VREEFHQKERGVNEVGKFKKIQLQLEMLKPPLTAGQKPA